MATTDTKRVALYIRVSKPDQTPDNQRLDLEQVAAQRGWQVVDTYVDHGISGAKGRDGRPAFARLCRDAIAGKFDVVAAWSVDRLGRSVLHLAQFVEDMRAARIGLFFLKQGLDSETPTGRAMLGMCSVFAELEREIIRERILAGIARARSHGTRSGRPIGRPRISNVVRRQIRLLRAKGLGKVRIARKLRCGVGSVVRELAHI
jgi:DNA invertase Pin-like site-specific DNA recombinase